MPKDIRAGLLTFAVAALSISISSCLRQADAETPKPPSKQPDTQQTVEPCLPVESSASHYTGMPYGILGRPLGSYLTIEGVRDANPYVKVGVCTLVVDSVNGKKLDKPVGIWVDNVVALPEAKRCKLRGYESGRIIGAPPAAFEAAKEEGKTFLPPQAGWQFEHYFIVLSVVQPKDLEIRNKKGPQE